MVIWKRRNPTKKYKDYGRYKSWLREDFEYACVYCSIHEGEIGGYESFHVEHFKPKSKFPMLETDYANLLYGCRNCNIFKGDDWPSNNPLKSGKGYIDPCKYDYEKYFSINKSCIIIGKVNAAKYMIAVLHLNRNFLIKIRKERKEISELISKHQLVIDKIDKILKNEKNKSKIKILNSVKSEMVSLLKSKEQEFSKRFTPPYEYEDLR